MAGLCRLFLMKLINCKNPKHVKYPHIINGLEGISIKFLNHPQTDIPTISDFRLTEIQEIIEFEAKIFNMYISH